MPDVSLSMILLSQQLVLSKFKSVFGKRTVFFKRPTERAVFFIFCVFAWQLLRRGVRTAKNNPLGRLSHQAQSLKELQQIAVK